MSDLPTVDLIVAAMWGVAVTCLILAAQRSQRRRKMRSRVTFNVNASPAGHAEGPRASLRVGISMLGTWAARRSTASIARLAGLIGAAGMTGRVTPAEILGWKIVLTTGGLLSGLFVFRSNSQIGFLVLLLFGIGGWAGPNLWLHHCRRVRFQQILRDLPTVIDLLALGLDAGMGLDRAITIICDRSRSPLTDELQRVLSDIGLGLSRQQAFAGLSERCKSDDIRQLSSSIIQSEQLGSSLVTTVKNQAGVLRTSRRRSAETQALKAPVKMLLPMVLFILPTLFLVVLGPPALNLTRALAQGHP